MIFVVHVPDQLWTYDKVDMKLHNKKYGVQENDWSIPNKEEDGILEEKSSGKVLSLKQKTDCDFGLFALLQKRERIKTRKGCKDSSDAKIWMRSKDINDGYFILKNKADGQLLTQISKSGKKKYRTAGNMLFDSLEI